MIELQRIVIVNCDEQRDKEGCYGEVIVSLESEETATEAMEFLESQGWTFDSKFFMEGEGIRACCPYCKE
ncbi:MAG: hypothetical protein GY853_01450 [PVC group bacterium]|nr:hypothetical protein [PVC group bacterium]